MKDRVKKVDFGKSKNVKTQRKVLTCDWSYDGWLDFPQLKEESEI